MPVDTDTVVAHKKNTRKLLRALKKAGFEYYKVNDGEESVESTFESDTIDNLTAVEETYLYVRDDITKAPIGRIFIVYDTPPGDIICDWVFFKAASSSDRALLEEFLKEYGDPS